MQKHVCKSLIYRIDCVLIHLENRSDGHFNSLSLALSSGLIESLMKACQIEWLLNEFYRFLCTNCNVILYMIQCLKTLSALVFLPVSQQYFNILLTKKEEKKHLSRMNIAKILKQQELAQIKSNRLIFTE